VNIYQNRIWIYEKGIPKKNLATIQVVIALNLISKQTQKRDSPSMILQRFININICPSRETWLYKIYLATYFILVYYYRDCMLHGYKLHIVVVFLAQNRIQKSLTARINFRLRAHVSYILCNQSNTQKTLCLWIMKCYQQYNFNVPTQTAILGFMKENNQVNNYVHTAGHNDRNLDHYEGINMSTTARWLSNSSETSSCLQACRIINLNSGDFSSYKNWQNWVLK